MKAVHVKAKKIIPNEDISGSGPYTFTFDEGLELNGVWEIIMKAQAITPDLKVELMEIGALMHKKGLPSSFIAAAVETAFEFEGVYDLMKMWADEKDKTEQDEIVADIQDLIDDCSQKKK